MNNMVTNFREIRLEILKFHFTSSKFSEIGLHEHQDKQMCRSKWK